MNATTLSPELEQYRTSCIAAVSEVVPEQVIDAAPFNRRGLYTNKLLGRFGFVPYLIGRAHAKAQAGGLPEQFLLVVTPAKVRALGYRSHGRRRDRFEVGEELGAWDRDAISVSWENGPPYQIDVTIDPGDGGDQLLCRCGRTAWSEGFLQTLSH